MNKRSGFTLAEVLITLVIIGIIAAMTVPTLMNNTNSQEYRTGLKKAIAMLNQALTMQYALDGTNVSDFSGTDNIRNSVFMKRLNVISTNNSSVFGSLGTSTTVFYTADGMKFGFGTAAAGTCTQDGSVRCYDIWIDVNGDKKPNTTTTSTLKPLDIYEATLYSQRVVPLGATTQGVMFDAN